MLGCIICTQAEMTLKDILGECKSEKWIPILVMRNGDETIVPLFTLPSVGMKFAKRNLPEKWLGRGRLGAMNLTPQDEQLMKEKGWTLLPMSFPRRFNYEFDIEVWEYTDDRDYRSIHRNHVVQH